MKPLTCTIFGFVLLSAAQASAESRSVLILVTHPKETKPQVTIRSDEKQERKQAVSIDEACAVIKEMKGWGSIVRGIVVSEQRLAAADLKKLLAAITANAWLELTYVRQGLSTSFVDHYLTTQGIEQPPTPAKPSPESGPSLRIGR